MWYLTCDTCNVDVGLPSVVVTTSVKLHISSIRIGVDRKAIGDNFPSGWQSKTWLYFMVLPKKGESNPYRMVENQL